MTLEYAEILTIKYKRTAETIHVTSDGSIYLNANIKALKKHAKENDLEIFNIETDKEKANKKQ